MITDSESPLIKIALLGNSGVGKTALVQRWINGVFPEFEISTIGAGHFHKTAVFEGKQIETVVWDTAGQEKYQSLVGVYTKGTNCAIIVCALDDKESINKIPDWVTLANNEIGPECPLILVGNKIDLLDQETITCHIMDLTKNFASQFVEIFSVSAKIGISVDDAFCRAAYEGEQDNIAQKGQSDQPLKPKEKHAKCCK